MNTPLKQPIDYLALYEKTGFRSMKVGYSPVLKSWAVWNKNSGSGVEVALIDAPFDHAIIRDDHWVQDFKIGK